MKKTLFQLILLISFSGQAQNIFKDDFSTYNTGVQLSGQGLWTNNSSNGGSGACTGALCSNAKVIAQNISYPGYSSSDKAFSLTPDTDGCGRLFGTSINSGNLYVGMVINISNAQTSPQDFFRVQNGSFISTTFRLLVQPTSGSTYSFGIKKGDTSNPTVFTNNSFNYGTDYLIILKYSFASGSNDDTVSLYVNPNYTSGESTNSIAVSTFAGADQASTVDRLVFRQNAGPAGMPTGRVGLVSVAQSWEDLSFTLSNETFQKSTFTVNSYALSQGSLEVKSSRSHENASLSLYDLQGKLIQTKKISLLENLNNIAVQPITQKGVYIVEITTADSERFSQKIVVP